LSTAAFSILGFIAANIAWLFALRTGVGIGKGFIVGAVLSGIGTVLLGVLVYMVASRGAPRGSLT